MRAMVTGSTGLLGNNLVPFSMPTTRCRLWRDPSRKRDESLVTLQSNRGWRHSKPSRFAYDLKGIDIIFHTAAYSDIAPATTI